MFLSYISYIIASANVQTLAYLKQRFITRAWSMHNSLPTVMPLLTTESSQSVILRS